MGYDTDVCESNEDVLREGECPQPNCIEAAGHSGPCSGEADERIMDDPDEEYRDGGLGGGKWLEKAMWG